LKAPAQSASDLADMNRNASLNGFNPHQLNSTVKHREQNLLLQ